MGVVVVVQLLAADENAPRHDILRLVGGFEIAVAGMVADAVYDAGGQYRNPQHLHGPNDNAHAAEENDGHRRRRADAKISVVAEHPSFPPVVGRSFAVFLQRLGRAAATVILRTFPEYFAQAVNPRAVRIVLGLGGGVVLAMHRRPLLRHHAGCQPQPQAEEEAKPRLQVQRSMRRMPMQIHRHGDDGDVRHDQRVRQRRPNGRPYDAKPPLRPPVNRNQIIAPRKPVTRPADHSTNRPSVPCRAAPRRQLSRRALGSGTIGSAAGREP